MFIKSTLTNYPKFLPLSILNMSKLTLTSDRPVDFMSYGVIKLRAMNDAALLSVTIASLIGSFSEKTAVS